MSLNIGIRVRVGSQFRGRAFTLCADRDGFSFLNDDEELFSLCGVDPNKPWYQNKIRNWDSGTMDKDTCIFHLAGLLRRAGYLQEENWTAIDFLKQLRRYVFFLYEGKNRVDPQGKPQTRRPQQPSQPQPQPPPTTSPQSGQPSPNPPQPMPRTQPIQNQQWQKTKAGPLPLRRPQQPSQPQPQPPATTSPESGQPPPNLPQPMPRTEPNQQLQKTMAGPLPPLRP